jgi:hypothetical protein
VVKAAGFLITLVLLAGACGGGGGGDQRGDPGGGELGLSVAFEPDPPEAGKPVMWSLRVRNDGGEAVTLTFPSGKRGDVVLEDERQAEAYRWSDGRFFTEAVTRERLGPDQEVVYRLEEPSLSVEAGDYDLVATLAAEPQVGPDRRRVHIR